ncbi:MAG: hypothetical protein IJP23_00145 [Oscillospiraceae bacterium]|nr:hypothetical protein [Oscillospiraceae bacterium]
MISGGSTGSFALVHNGTIPKGINHLRIGEGAILCYDLKYEMNIPGLDFLHSDAFTLYAEVLEVKTKPSHPVGEIIIDANGDRPVFENRGDRKPALLGVGRVELGGFQRIHPMDTGIEVLGGSSDHMIVDVENYAGDLKPGDVLGFTLNYTAALFATACRTMNIEYIGI